MQPGQVRCVHCGWQNQVSDRMCGGCGKPLLHPGSSFGVPAEYTPTVASSGPVAPPPLSPDTRTATWSAPAYPKPYTPQTATVAATPLGAAPAYAPARGSQARAKGRSCLARTLIAFAIAAILLLVLMACGWSAFLRPALHTAVDQRLREGLSAEMSKVPVIPPGFPPITRTITDADFNRQASGGAGQNNQGDMKDIRIHFLPGEVTMTYRLWGSPGKITTHIVTVNGRLFVQNTRVEGWLTQIENGDELQDTLNQSLARLPAQDYVENVIVGDGTLTLTIRRA
jgi:hypothetical protein